MKHIQNKSKKIPRRVYIASNKSIPVIQKEIEKGRLGYFDGNKEEIAISKSQSEIGKWIILIHEVLHALDEQNVQNGLYKKQLTENQVQFISAGLFASLSMSCGLPKFSKKEIIDFFTTKEESGE